MKKLISFMFLLIFPITVYAYPEYLIASGDSIGIELKSSNIIIVGSYEIDSYNVLASSDLEVGDKIVKINDYLIKSASDMQKIINEINTDRIKITYKRNNNLYTTTINLKKEDNEYRSGLYVRDAIRGVATLTYIDTESKSFGALGHEILEKTTKSSFDADNGTIFKSTISSITKSSDGNPGEKNATSDSSIIYGTVKENTKSGVFGSYTANIPNKKLYKVAKPNEIHLGKAKILTVIDGNQVEEFTIDIQKINDSKTNKNILFEVTDKRLLDITGGIVQGMSGSPIIQDNNIIGAVNFVVVDKTNKGYGIFITTMLEEAEN